MNGQPLLDMSTEAIHGPERLAAFVRRFGALLDEHGDEEAILTAGEVLLRDLVSVDDWLPETHARAGLGRYQQYLLHLDPEGRFSVVSFVWGPGQSTPIHDHRTWGLVGVLRGAEQAEAFSRHPDGLHWLRTDRLEAGQVDAVSPRLGDIHRVANAVGRTSISIHVYGVDIGSHPRAIYDAAGNPKRFVSAYADAPAIQLGEQT